MFGKILTFPVYFPQIGEARWGPMEKSKGELYTVHVC